MGSNTPAPFRLVVVAPVYDDAASATRLLQELEQHFSGLEIELRVLLVDDGSHTPLAEVPGLANSFRRGALEILRLRRNVGHQRAIALGAAYVHDEIPCEAMLVMDADGEDRPEDAVALAQYFRNTNRERIVFAERTRRTESSFFRVLYRLYQFMHWVLTGIRVRVGNFSIVPARCLPALVTLPALWNHYAAAIFQSRLPFEMIPTQRGQRYCGQSKMNYLSLIMHGLHAISVFSDLVAVRLLLAVFALTCLCGGVLLANWAAHFYSSSGVAPWVLAGWCGLLILLLLTLGCFSLVLHLMSQRNSLDFIPIRDYKYFVETVSRIAPPHE